MSQDNFDQEIQDAQVANPDVQDHSENTEKTTQEAAPEIDWKEKFVNSQKGALELLEENKLLKSQQAVQEEFQGQAMESLYPGFEQLDSEAQANILAFSEGITKKAKEEFYKDPAIAFARKNYNETVFDNALNSVVSMYPELSDTKDEFKNKYFNANNVPSNIQEILVDLAKSHLFDKARAIGAKDEQVLQSRVESERATGGNRTQTTARSLEDWTRMSQENPVMFASLSKEYNADLATGKLRE